MGGNVSGGRGWGGCYRGGGGYKWGVLHPSSTAGYFTVFVNGDRLLIFLLIFPRFAVPRPYISAFFVQNIEVNF